MNRQCVILCERGTTWAAMLQRQLPRGVELRQSRTLLDCGDELAVQPGSLVAVELTRDNFAGALSAVCRWTQEFPMARVMVLADSDLESFEWALREAGAVHFTVSPRQLDGMAHLVQRHFERQPQRSPTGLAAAIWDTLPWSDVVRA
jgi:hypothetical protein